MTSLTFYGGVNEIGGNKIILEDGDTQVLLDFGMSFSRAKKYFDTFMQPRKFNGIRDLLEFGLLPDLKGLYRCDYMEHCGFAPESEPNFDGVLLTHAHMDHCSYVHYLREDIPIYCTQACKDIKQAIDETGSSATNELIWLKESFKTYINKKGGESRLKGEKAQKLRSHNIVNGRFVVGRLEGEAWPVSHSLEGAIAYILFTEAGPVVYTGDFRFHGYKGDFTRDFIERAAEIQPVAMICEGTRIDEARSDSEERVKAEIKVRTDETENLVVANFPVRDTDRMMSFLAAAKATDRALVINLKQAYLLELFKKSGIAAPEIDNDHIRIYVPRKGWGVFRDERFSEEMQLTDYFKWERDLLDHPHIVTAQDIHKHQNEYIFRCDFFELKELIDVRPEAGSCYIWSVCEPFDQQMELDKQRVENWLEHFGLRPYSEIHASGHASHDEIKNAVETIQPKMLIPIHTEHPEFFREFHDNVIIPTVGMKLFI